MSLIRKRKIGLTGKDFSQGVMNRHPDLRISTNITLTAPVNKITSPIEFLKVVYYFPFMILKKEITNSFRKTERSLKSLNISNISLNLDFPFDNFLFNTYKLGYIPKYLPGKNGKLPPSFEEYMPEKRVSNVSGGPLPPSKSDIFSKFSRESPSPAIHKKIYNMPEKESASASGTKIKYFEPEKTDPHGNFREKRFLGNEIRNERWSFLKSNHFPQLISRIESFRWNKNKLSPEKLGNEKTYFTTLNGFKDINGFKDTFDGNDPSKILNDELNYIYPKIEHFNVVKTEITKEKLIETENSSKNPQIPEIDLNRIADQVYSSLEMKLKIEKERRGLFG